MWPRTIASGASSAVLVVLRAVGVVVGEPEDQLDPLCARGGERGAEPIEQACGQRHASVGVESDDRVGERHPGCPDARELGSARGREVLVGEAPESPLGIDQLRIGRGVVDAPGAP